MARKAKRGKSVRAWGDFAILLNELMPYRPEGKWTQDEFIQSLKKMKNHNINHYPYPRYEITEIAPGKRGRKK